MLQFLDAFLEGMRRLRQKVKLEQCGFTLDRVQQPERMLEHLDRRVLTGFHHLVDLADLDAEPRQKFTQRFGVEVEQLVEQLHLLIALPAL